MQVDEAELEAESNDAGGHPDSQLDDTHPDDAKSSKEDTDDEYESWEGFGSSAHLFFACTCY